MYGELQPNTAYDSSMLPTPSFGDSGSMGSLQSLLSGGLIGGGLGSALGGLLGMNDFQNPANSAMPYFNQMAPMMQQYLSSFINNGLQAGGVLQGQYNNLLSNPGGMLNTMGKSFQQSPGYQFQVNQALNAANRASASSGMQGTPEEQQNIASTVNNLANQDYYNYLNHTMGLYGQGLSGEQNMYGLGASSANSLAEGLAQALAAQAKMAYAGTEAQNESQQGGLGAILGGLGSAAGGLMSLF